MENEAHPSLSSDACVLQLGTRPCLGIYALLLHVWISCGFPGICDCVGAGLSAIDECATMKCRMDLCRRLRFLPEEAYLEVIAGVVELIGPRTFSLGHQKQRQCEMTFYLLERGGSL